MTRRLIGIAVFALASFFAVEKAYAGEYAVSTTIHIYGQAEDVSTAHAITTTTTLSTCALNALYIRFEDKALFATALTAAANGTTVTVRYDDNAATKYSAGILNGTCKVISISY